MYIQSRVVPNLTIETSNPYLYKKTESALFKISAKPIGQALLREINSLARNERCAFVIPNESFDCSAKPMLTYSQLKTYGPPPIDEDEDKWNMYKAIELVTSTQKGGKGIGTTAVSYWNPNEFIHIDLFGHSHKVINQYSSFLSLAHELIHVRNILKGDVLINSEGGLSRILEEEYRVLGLPPYHDEPITENKIRLEHGYPYRFDYQHLDN